MQKISIKTHKPGKGYQTPHLFILNKGNNSGKPLHEACPNCFVILFQDSKDFDSLYWLAYGLWKAGFWRYYMVGSVILFLRLSEFKKAFEEKVVAISGQAAEHHRNISALRMLDHKEAQFHQNLALISDMRRAILYRYILKS